MAIDYFNIIHLFFTGILGLITFTVALLFFFRDLDDFEKTKSWHSLIPSMISATCIITLLAMSVVLGQRDAGPLLFSGKSQTDHIILEFRKNGHYKITPIGLVSRTIRGTYKIKDSLILLDEPHPEENIISDRLVIRLTPNEPDSETSFKVDSAGNLRANPSKTLYQVDAAGNLITNVLSLRVDVR